jgi:arginase
MHSNLKLLEIPSELGAGTRGSSLGISALKTASLGSKSDYFACLPSTKVRTENKELFSAVVHPYAKRIPHIWTMWQRVSSSIKSTLEDGNFPIVLTGDHSTAGGLISGMKMAYPEKRVGVIWIDAHADIHSPYTTPSGNVHGMPIAALLNDDNMEMKRNENLDLETVAIWQNMKKLGGISPKIQGENIVYIAVRDTEEEEDHIIEKKKIKKISVASLRQKGIEMIVSEVLEYLKVDVIYISFDVDSMDPTLSRGTGTPVPLGISNVEAEELIKGLVQDSRVKAFEMTEVNPTLDTENKMAKNAFKILSSVTDSIYARLQEESKK